jgi:Zn-dependent protease/CBS domain-containing protein
MNETLRLGTIAGVRIGVNWTVLVIFTLVLVGLAAGRFPLTHPGHETWAYVLAGAVAAVAFFASLLAHEVSHAVVAQRNGIEVEGIVLWLFGGVAKLRSEADDPATDLRVAGIGPLVSLVLGVAFATLAVLASGLGLAGLPLAVLGWLALINVVLAVFNLVPATPLDGGRILRAWLWYRRGDRVSAAVSAARAGRTFGFSLVGLGLVSLLVLPGLGGLWFVLIGWFIANAAAAEEQHAVAGESLRGLLAGDVMSSGLITVPSGLDVGRLVDEYALRHRCSAFPVVGPDGELRGLVTLHHVRRVAPEARATTAVDRIATPAADVPVVAVDTPLPTVLDAMRDTPDGRVLVRGDSGVPIGIVSPTDVARTVEISQLRPPRPRPPHAPSAPR